jgi:proline iminopeptidase
MHITVNGTRLYVDVEGPGLAVVAGELRSRPCLLGLHGGPGFDQGYLRPGLSALRDDVQLVFVDLRGQGRSAPEPAESCTLEQMADDVAGLCSTLGIARPVVFGHSAGGFVALQLAVRHPALASGLILCNTAGSLGPMEDPASPPGPLERGGAAAGAAATRLFSGDFSEQAGEDFDRLVLPFYAAPGHEHIPGQLMALSSLNPEIAAYFFQHLAPRYDLSSRLPAIDVPTLVIVGQHDWVCPPVAGRALAAAIPAATLVELPDAGHFSFSETPAAFLPAVRGHLNQISVDQPSDQRDLERVDA